MDSALEPPEGGPLWGHTDWGAVKLTGDLGLQSVREASSVVSGHHTKSVAACYSSHGRLIRPPCK